MKNLGAIELMTNRNSKRVRFFRGLCGRLLASMLYYDDNIIKFSIYKYIYILTLIFNIYLRELAGLLEPLYGIA